MIPREGVESDVRHSGAPPLEFACDVIPREGVESVLNARILSCKKVVIPREGVEIKSQQVVVFHTIVVVP